MDKVTNEQLESKKEAVAVSLKESVKNIDHTCLQDT